MKDKNDRALKLFDKLKHPLQLNALWIFSDETWNQTQKGKLHQLPGGSCAAQDLENDYCKNLCLAIGEPRVDLRKFLWLQYPKNLVPH